MPVGPGKYGADAQRLIEAHGATLCLVVIVGGDRGSSFDVATSDPMLLRVLPAFLRAIADNIEPEVETDVTAHQRHRDS